MIPVVQGPPPPNDPTEGLYLPTDTNIGVVSRLPKLQMHPASHSYYSD